ncbi:helix-turn-helix domain-containing protein [Amycolatopsis sp. cmx-4-68]|uniref:helix-turn-helix domain-containing protein n=1 Tax=Amycolatopsis sp. cmx-4-68 TaxID=2790938 RepID=UPI00397E3A32
MRDELGGSLRRLRCRAGLTQEVLAERSGVSVRTIQGLETGTRRNPRRSSLRQIAEALALTPSERELLLEPADPGPVAGFRPVPRQLPPAPRGFVGRGSALADLGDDLLLVVGAGGIGKTALAVHWAHRQLDRFPDGQLFVDLQGFCPDKSPLDPLTVVRGFLDALGVDRGRARSLADHTGLYRSVVADRRMLVVLDNAASDGQVEPLLPGSPSCTTVITSRRSLPTLTTRYGAHHVPLTVLSGDDALALFVRRCGESRVAAEPAAVVRELIAGCGGYPLALATVASRVHRHPDIPLAEFVAELREVGLAALDADDPSISLPAVLSWSVRALTGPQRRLFGKLGVAPHPDIGLPAAATLAGVSIPQARRMLRELAEASLVARGAGDRYSMHDLVRRYAAQTAATESA